MLWARGTRRPGGRRCTIPTLNSSPSSTILPVNPGLHTCTTITTSSASLYTGLSFSIPPYSFLCGALAFLNVSFPPKHAYEPLPSSEEYPLASLKLQPRARKPNERRSRATFALIVFLTFLAISVIGAVFGSTIMSLVVFGLFKAGKYNMST